ncbi:glycosyltransferase [Pseudanabaena sp. lw0831]|uniref:glycosyltransferase family 2 protein n=1 Tax=Pseudanabaena sp. lw0831 TaxID=1357935 RepID=UPI001915C663|nr:glycosyltransferase family A protein [Pseudanabaena sp. lw0831]GBO53799.1 glycosyltransferase [Pseudanabaena sp. lw0831]
MEFPLVSVIVPTYNSADFLEPCLKSILEQCYEKTELIVVDNSSDDNTQMIAKRYTEHVYNKGDERSAQRNFGVHQSSGEYVLMIDSDMVLTKGVVRACVEVIQKDLQLKALIIPEESFGEGVWAKCKKLERSFYSGVDWQEASRFFDKNAYLEAGGYDEAMTGWEDYDLPNRIESKHGAGSIGRVKTLIYHNERNLNLFTSCRKKFYYAKTLDLYIHKDTNKDRLHKQTSIIRRYGVFFANPVKLFKNPFLGIGMLFMKTCEFAAGASGYVVGKFSSKQ